MPIDYSKWKDIEVSDDEDDTHPNIDTPSLFRWRHQARLERMAEKKQEKEKIESEKSKTSDKMKKLEEKLATTSIDEKERIKTELEMAEMKKQEAEWLAKEKDLAERERLEAWNVDTIGHDAFSSTRINKVNDKKQKFVLSEEEESMKMAVFCDENEDKLHVLGKLVGIPVTEKYLAEHPYLACDWTANWLTIECLNLAIDRKDDKMCVMAQQCIIIQYLLELSKNLKADPTNTNMQHQFFKKFANAEPHYMKSFHDEVAAFQDRIRKRAQDKREAAFAEHEKLEKEERVKASPGGLDPQEVFESLPEEMRTCFETQNIPALKELAMKMDEEVFTYHFNRCIASGLWVPEKTAEAGDDDDDNNDEPRELTEADLPEFFDDVEDDSEIDAASSSGGRRLPNGSDADTEGGNTTD